MSSPTEPTPEEALARKRERAREHTRKWRAKPGNAEKSRASRRAAYWKDPEKYRAKGREDRKKRRQIDPEGARRNNREWYAAEPSRKKRQHLKSLYGLSLEEYEAMLEKQGGVCAVSGCGRTNGNKSLYVDHCHRTGKVRGLLCSNCNAAIGMMRDSPTLIVSLNEYLKNSGAHAPPDKNRN